LGNIFFKRAYFIYFPLYRIYKNVSDKREVRLIKKYIEIDSNVVDIGANIGFYTRLFSKKVGENGKVYAFEPSPENYERLRQNTIDLKNVFIRKAAVGNTNSKLRLYVSNDLNVDHRTYPTKEMRRSVEVDCIRLDAFFQENKKIDFIKLDVQGFEYQAILGMQEIIEENKELKMMIEFWPSGLNEAGSDPQNLIELLKRCGFHLYMISKNGLIKFSNEQTFKDNEMYYTIFAMRDLINEIV
jgi:FkbM family methyltransferase